ncbi:transposase [Holospora undulata]|uniref:Transposase n=1 Tax=Holospora undulata HU1 TaxID=1321371 RepID=A0A061JGH9_9PROT|nr:transposase [Holospora undulata HU1]
MIKHHFDSGNKSKYNKKEGVNAVVYIIKSGCQWRMLPKDFPPYSTVHSFYRRCRIKGVWEKVMHELVKTSRIKYERSENPSYSIIHKVLKPQESQKK